MEFSKEDTEKRWSSQSWESSRPKGFKQPEITEGCDFIKSRKGLFDEAAQI